MILKSLLWKLQLVAEVSLIPEDWLDTEQTDSESMICVNNSNIRLTRYYWNSITIVFPSSMIAGIFYEQSIRQRNFTNVRYQM